MEKFFLKPFLALSLFILSACSGVEPDNISGIDPNTVVSGSFTTNNNSKIAGSGTILFTETLSIFSSRSIAINASLDSAVGSSTLTAVFYSNNAAIPATDGIAVTFRRSGASVTAQISFNGTSSTVEASKMSFFFPTALDLIVEVHNVNSQAQVLVWRRNLIEYSPATADIDTSRTGDLDTPLPNQRGTGPYVGLILENATVNDARLGSQKVLD